MSSSVILKSEGMDLSSDTFLKKILKQCEAKVTVENAAIAESIKTLRQQAVSQVLESRIPTKKDEEWRFTDLDYLLQTTFQIAQKATISIENLEKHIFPEAKQSRLVFVNGFYAAELSDVSGLPAGVYVGNLANLEAAKTDKITQYLARQEGSDEIFTALNTAGLADAAIIWANANVTVKTPIHLLFITVPTEVSILSQPRILVVAETSSSLQFVEHYVAVGEALNYFTNAVTEIWVGDNAQVEHNRIQLETNNSFHIGKSAIAQSKDSHYTCNEISLGGKLYRHNLEIFQQGEQTQTNLNGLIAIGGDQLADTHSAIRLTKPYGTTDQLHKCIVNDGAHAVFNGKVFVPKAAQLTNAAQLNRNLLLSPKARVNTKPELQITADNVKCSHGATVSQLEADELFYLRSRGLTEADARHLLIDAFAAEIIERISIKSLCQKLTQLITFG